MRNLISLILTTAILWATTLEARTNTSPEGPSGKAPAGQSTKIKEKLLNVPPGTLIEVRLLNNQKVRGKLGQMNDEGFTLTAVEQGKIVIQKIAFNELKSFKRVTSATTKTGHTLIYILAGVGALMLIAIIWGVAQG